jgi:hypothetical protein
MMNNGEANPKSDGGQAQGAHADGDEWKEVGSQFKELGESLAAAFQAAWKNEEVRQQAREMRTGLEALVKEVGQAIKDTANSPEVHRATHDAVKAGEHAIHEARPHLVEALRKVNLELQSLIDRMEKPRSDSGGG